jgi:hypothetical protein
MKLERQELVETISAARGLEGWHFAEVSVSSLFRYCASDEWQLAIYAPYFRDFWEPVLTALDEHESVVEITLNCVYDYGVSPEADLRPLLDEWRTNRDTRTKPNMLAVSETTTDEAGREIVTVVHLVIAKFGIKALENVEA